MNVVSQGLIALISAASAFAVTVLLLSTAGVRGAGLMLGGMLAGAVVLLASGLAVRVYLQRPLERVQRVVYELTEGNFGSRIGRDQAGPLAGLMRSLDDLSGVFQRWSAAARASERRYRLLYEHSPAALFRTRLDGRMLECNQAAVTALGYDSVVDVTTRNARTFFADPAERDALLERFKKDGLLRDVRVAFLRKDGTRVPILLNAVATESDGEATIDGQFLDLTAGRSA